MLSLIWKRVLNKIPTSVSGFHLSDSLFVLILDHTVAINDKENYMYEQFIPVFQKKKLKQTLIHHINHNSPVGLLTLTYVQVRLQ